MMLSMEKMTSQAGQVAAPSLTCSFDEIAPDLDDVTAAELSVIESPLSDPDRRRLTEYWSRVVAECDADLPRFEAPARPMRRARRVERQHTNRLVRVLRVVRDDDAAAISTGVAA